MAMVSRDGAVKVKLANLLSISNVVLPIGKMLVKGWQDGGERMARN